MKKEQNLNNAETQALNIPVVNKRFWGGFGKIKTEVEYCTLANPMLLLEVHTKQYYHRYNQL